MAEHNHNDTDDAPACGRQGCQEAVSMLCAGCANEGYCSEEHAKQDWKNHVEHCALAMTEEGTPVWTVEEEWHTDDPEGATEWVAVPMVHVVVDAESGRPVATLINADAIIEGAATNDGFETRTVGLFGEGGKVRKGKRIEYGSVVGRVAVMDVYGNAEIDLVVEAGVKETSQRGGRSGRTFEFSRKLLDQAASVGGNRLESVSGRGDIVLGVEYMKEKHQVYGRYDLGRDAVESRKSRQQTQEKQLPWQDRLFNWFSDQGESARRAMARGSRKLVGSAQRYRVKARDQFGVQAAAVFTRKAYLDAQGMARFELESFAVHVPETMLGQGDRDWVRDDDSSRNKLVRTLRGLGLGDDDDDANMPMDAECLPDMLSLLECVADVHEQLRAAVPLGDEHAQNLRKAARVRATLEKHCATLRAEDLGEVEPENIPFEVEQAIAHGLELVEANWFTNLYRKGAKNRAFAKNTAATIKSLPTLSDDMLVNRLKSRVLMLKNDLDNNREGSRHRRVIDAIVNEMENPTRLAKSDARGDMPVNTRPEVQAALAEYYGFKTEKEAKQAKKTAVREVNEEMIGSEYDDYDGETIDGLISSAVRRRAIRKELGSLTEKTKEQLMYHLETYLNDTVKQRTGEDKRTGEIPLYGAGLIIDYVKADPKRDREWMQSEKATQLRRRYTKLVEGTGDAKKVKRADKRQLRKESRKQRRQDVRDIRRGRVAAGGIDDDDEEDDEE